MTAATASTLGVTLTELSRRLAAQLAHRPYRSADTGAWCSPTTPHVPGCVCEPGAIGCAADGANWADWAHAVAASAEVS